MAVTAPTGRDPRPLVAPPWAATPSGAPDLPPAPAGLVSARRHPWTGRGERVPAPSVRNVRDLLVAAALYALIALLC